MFDNLTDRLSGTLQRLRGRATLTENNISEALRDVRIALLEADVALPVVKAFIDRVRDRAVGQEVLRSLSPGQALVKVVHDELVAVMGGESEGLDLKARPPAVVLMAGLQGSGKTTTTAKLAKWLKERAGKSVMVTSCDVYRPAAIDQLQRLAEQVDAAFHPSSQGQDPVTIGLTAVDAAKRAGVDVLIVDSAGRLAIDDAMMAEIRAVHGAISPAETLFVVDAMTGQDAAATAKAFDEALALTGVVLSKADGDARGGAALSVRHVTGKPIKFIGVGEKVDALEPFHPDRIAQRILGMGDVLSLVEEVQRKVDVAEQEKLAKKLSKGKKFTLEDFRTQLEQMMKMGGMAGMMDKLPGMGQIPEAAKDKVDDAQTTRMVAIINSMTPQERRFPDTIRGSRKRRIAGGSGTSIQDVTRLLKQFGQAQRMMRKVSRGGMQKLLKRMGGGQMPGGMPPMG